MGQARSVVAETVTERLYRAENAIDAALRETAGLIAYMPEARTDALLSATAGQGAFAGVAAAVSALTEARGRLVRAHHDLDRLARRLGVDVVAVGPVDKPDDEPPVGGGEEERAETRAGRANSGTPSLQS